ncbi:MAG: T9SS type A sorting domain-containing protein [Ferruginibacter sp.]
MRFFYLLLASVAISLLTSLANVVSGQSIFDNSITGINPNISNPYTTGQFAHSNITASGIGRGTGIAGTNTNDRYNATGWNSAALDLNDYFEFILTPNVGNSINFVSFVYTGQASGTGPANFELRSSVDGFVSGIGTPTATGTTISLSAAVYQNRTTATTFRLYGWNASNVLGTFSINDFTFNGIVPTVSITNTGTPATGLIQPNTNNVVLSAFEISANVTTDFTGVTISKTGTATTSDLSNLRIFYDANSNSIIDGLEASVSGSLALASSMPFTIAGQTSFTTARRYLVVADVAAGATLNNTVTTSIAASADVVTSVSNVTGTAPGNMQTVAYISLATDYFRSNITSGNWATTTSWQSSHNNVSWFTATLAPSSAASTINIRSGHTINVNSSVSLDETTIAGVLELQTGGILNINNGTGDDVSISANGILRIASTNNYGTAVVSGSAQINIATGGKITIGDGSASLGTGYETFATSSSNTWNNGAIYEYNSNTTFATSGLIYFPNAAAGVIPIFRVTKVAGLPGTAGPTVINGMLEVNYSFTFAGSGLKTFRDGIIGTATLTLDATLGTTTISAATAVLGGSLTLTLNKTLNLTNGVAIPLGANVLINGTNDISKNGGSFLVNGTVDITDRTISNTTGNVTVNGTLKTSMTNGLYNSGNIASGSIIINPGSAIEYNALSNQSITGTTVLGQSYYNITFSGSGTKTPLSAINVDIAGTVKITGSAIVDATSNNLGLTSGNSTNFIMDGGRLIVGTGGTKPNMDGIYTLTGGVVEFATGGASKTIRSKSYQNIEVTGNNVSNSSGNITLNSLGTFTVKNGGVFLINDNSIVGPTGTQTVTVENGGLFKTGNNEGFHGFAATFTNNSSIHLNIENINLNSGSMVEYTRAGTQPITNSSSLIYENLILSGPGSKTAPSGNLEIRGNLIGSGTANFVHNNGTVIMSGTNGQTYNATTPFIFYNFTNSSLLSGGGLTINSNTTVAKELKLNSLSGIFLNSGDITLKSDLISTANVAAVPFEPNIITYNSGRFNVERYYPADRSWRLITSPLSAHGTPGSIFSQWQNGGVYTAGIGAFVTGPGAPANGLDVSSFNNYSLKTFVADNYVNIGNTTGVNLSGTTLSAANIGYFMFVRGDRNRSPDNTIYPNTNPTTLNSRGKLQTGPQTFDVTNASTLTSPSFSLIGNPYASSIDFNAITKVNVNPNRFYIWDPHINQVGAYVVMEDLTTPGSFQPQAPYGTSPQRNYIQSSQAFFVERASPGPASLVFDESNKSNDYTPALFRPASGDNIASIRSALLLLQNDNSTILADGSLAQFRNDFNNAVDIKDAYKFLNIHENLGFTRNGNILAIERRANIIADDTLFYYLKKLTPRNYRLELVSENMDPLVSAFLEDIFTGTKTPVNLAGTTSYDFNVNAGPESYAPDRFRLVFKNSAGSLPVTLSTVKAFEQGKNIKVEWTVENELNANKYEVEKSIDGINFTKVNITIATGANSNTITYTWLDNSVVTGNNFYRIRTIDAAGKTVYSPIVKVNRGNTLTGFSIYPNPVNGGIIGLQFNNIPAGRYQLRLFNDVGQLLFTKSVEHTRGTTAESITPSMTLAKGIYQLEIRHPDKTNTTLKVIN